MYIAVNVYVFAFGANNSKTKSLQNAKDAWNYKLIWVYNEIPLFKKLLTQENMCDLHMHTTKHNDVNTNQIHAFQLFKYALKQ